SARIEAWRAELTGRPEVAAAIESLDDVDLASVGREARDVIALWRRDVRLGGAGLPAPAREEIRRLSRRLIELQAEYFPAYGRNQSVDLPLDALAGVPRELVDGLEPGGAPGTLRVVLHEPMTSAILEC